jgi:prepilin-type N-terminal cleavage/methylation domain-containing protein
VSVPRPHAWVSARVTRAWAAFTLLELLVVMGILLILATLTAISVGKVTRDAKLANATNVLVAALGNARAIAIRDNAYVMVTFRIAPDRRGRALPREPQVVQVVTARWTGEVLSRAALGASPPAVVSQFPDDVFAERFIPVPGVPTRELPAGILVGGPAFGYVTDAAPGVNDKQWRTQPRFAGTLNLAATPPTFAVDINRSEVGWAIGVLFGPDGRVLSRNPEQVLEVNTEDAVGSAANAYVKGWVDIDGDGYPRRGSINLPGWQPTANVSWFVYKEPTDEPLVDLVPFLAVFNDAEARERFDAASWRGPNISGSGPNPNAWPNRIRDQSAFIEEQSDRITFNRFTGVPGIVPK